MAGRKKKERKRGGVKEARHQLVLVDHDAVLEESGQAAALHANQISQLRGLFVRWHRWLLRARALLSSLPLQPTHALIHTQKEKQNIPASFHPSAGFPALCILSLFC